MSMVTIICDEGLVCYIDKDIVRSIVHDRTERTVRAQLTEDKEMDFEYVIEVRFND